MSALLEMERTLVSLDRRPYTNLARRCLAEGAELEELAEAELVKGEGVKAAAYAALATMKYTKAAAVRAVRPA